MTRVCFQNGGTGVSPVKSGVSPDFVRNRPALVVRRTLSQSTTRNGFGRDARNDRPEACATHLILKTRPNDEFANARLHFFVLWTSSFIRSRAAGSFVIRHCLLLLLVSVAAAETNSTRISIGAANNVSLRNEVQRAIEKGIVWLEKNQNTNGYWSAPEDPAVTALALVALKKHANGRVQKESAAVKRGYDYLLSCIQPDGGIYKKDLVNYNTAVSLMALVTRNRAEDKTIILRARNFLIGLQNDFGEKGKIDDTFDGGIGYGTKYKHSDMGNTSFALEAIRASKQIAEDSSSDARDLNWPAVIHFLERCQNLPGHNPEKWASDDPQNKGGFVYYPGHSMAGETNLPNGRVALRSYGSISYAGLLSYIYADLRRDDPRVVAVMDWLQKNYTLDENPGMGAQGLYFYLHTMTKALTIYGANELETSGGKRINWREQLALKLVNLQNADGSWSNDAARWRENDPALVTAYAMISLELIFRKL